MSETTWFIAAIVIYMAVMLAIGYWSYTKTDKYDDYVLAGRGLNPFVAAMSAGASDMSGWLLMGLPGALFVTGLVSGCSTSNGGLQELASGVSVIEPGDPSASYLFRKLVGTQSEGCGGSGMQMPVLVDLSGSDPLPQDQLDLIEAWILDGAMP